MATVEDQIKLLEIYVRQLEMTIGRLLPRYLRPRFVSNTAPTNGQVYAWDTAGPRFAPTTLATTLLSGTFAIDSTGIKTVTIAHGLAAAPSIQDCQLTVTEQTNVDDWRTDLLKVDSVDATNVTAKINVSTASVTAGATARLALLIWNV